MENCYANFINYREYLKETSHSTENIPLLPKFSNRFMKEFDLNFSISEKCRDVHHTYTTADNPTSITGGSL